MKNLQSILPAGKSWRELYLPQLINNNASLPGSVIGGHPLTLTGARKGSTCNGVHFNGAADSNINCGAIHNAAAKLWVSLRFKLDQPYSPGMTDQNLFGKFIDFNDRLHLRLSADGTLRGILTIGGTDRFGIAAQDGGADITSWEAGRWYHVLLQLSDTAGRGRLIVDGGTAVLTNDVNAAPNGGDFVIGDLDDPGTGDGFEGIIADVVVGTDDLTTSEETRLYNGFPPPDATEFWPLDEGRGTTAYNRGSAGAGSNGTLDTTAEWDFEGQPRLAALSVDGINDRGQSSAGVDISGDLSLVWIGKLKFAPGLNQEKDLVNLYVDADNNIIFFFSPFELTFRGEGGGDISTIDYASTHNIDDYLIFIGTITVPRAIGNIRFFANGILVAENTFGGVGPISAAAATAYIGCSNVPDNYEVSKPLLVGLIDGALTAQEALVLSRYFDQKMGLGLVI